MLSQIENKTLKMYLQDTPITVEEKRDTVKKENPVLYKYMVLEAEKAKEPYQDLLLDNVLDLYLMLRTQTRRNKSNIPVVSKETLNLQLDEIEKKWRKGDESLHYKLTQMVNDIKDANILLFIKEKFIRFQNIGNNAVRMVGAMIGVYNLLNAQSETDFLKSCYLL